MFVSLTRSISLVILLFATQIINIISYHLPKLHTTMTFLPNTNNNAPMPSSSHLPYARIDSRLSSTMSEDDDPEDIMESLATEMKQRAQTNQPFTEDEINYILKSIQNILELNNKSDDASSSIDMAGLSNVLRSVAHYTHKEWDKTSASSHMLKEVLLPNSNEMTPIFQTLMERVLSEGNWFGALEATASLKPNSKPWVVLVTGVNGIRKTTSIYQPWFSTLLSQALVPPSGSISTSDNTASSPLPNGGNSFFRQLDHMIAILANEEFQSLYSLTAGAVKNKTEVQKSTIDKYSHLKDAIFTRYRTLAEMMGILLIQLAQNQNSNVMVETSGRDIAMFQYIDRFFPSSYNKLALHFTINDISHAESSVDNRMVQEIHSGIEAMNPPLDIQKVVYANAGGPYGSSVLKGVQRDSDKVWEKIISNTDHNSVGSDWFKASIEIQAHKDKDWTACAVKSDGTKGDYFTFSR